MNKEINLNLGDCMEAMREMPDNAFDLAIVDPPYLNDYDKMKGLNKDMKGKKAKVGKYHFSSLENSAPQRGYFEELQRITKNRIIWGCNYYARYIADFGRIVWDKQNDSSTFSKCELASHSFGLRVDQFRYMWNGMLQGDMKNKEKRIHPTQKPVALYKWLLKNYAKEGDKILDTHLGSGSIAIACHDGGFALDAWEIDAEYHKLATERFNTHIKQLRLL